MVWWREGVGLWPSDVTTAVMRLVLEGRAGCSALARTAAADVLLIDAGSQAPAGLASPLYRDWRVTRGSMNLARGPAMTAADFDAALDVGARAARSASAEGVRVLALGELGIGNTTPAACLAALLTGSAPADMVGPGAGATEANLARKRQIVAEAVQRARETLADDPRASMASVCGYEIAALAGCMIEAARHGITVVLDGFIVGAAALVAQRLSPTVAGAMIAAHRSQEPGHAAILSRLGLEPFLEWELRLGEGTGALLLLPLLDAAAAVLRDMATLAEAVGG